MSTRSLVYAAAVAVALLGCQKEPTGPSSEMSSRPEQSAARQLEGWFHTLWVDPVAGNGAETVRYVVVDGRGHGTELELSPGLANQWGGPRGLNGRKVRVEGTPGAGARLRVRSIEPVAGVTPAQTPGWGTVQTGPHPFVTILCKFSDIAVEPFPMSTYKQWTTGTTYPSLDHYWREVSYNQMNVSGSALVGWYTLPYPLSHYGTGWPDLDLDGLARDCTSAADADVDFPRFWGINMQFNGNIKASLGSAGYTLTADGQTKTYGMTWLYPWGSLAGYVHEDFHALGLMHSTGWDPLGQGGSIVSCGGAGVPLHTISWHKDVLGWIPEARKLIVGPNTSQTITLERLALPGSGNYLMAQIPMDNAPGQFYTVETRRRAGYDDCLPGDAVVLEQVDPARGDRLAQMVDGDNNGILNDAGAMWTPGETFTDAANGITVTVNAQTATGFQVTIKRGAAGAWASRAAMPTARRALAVSVANATMYAIGGASAAGTVLHTVQAYNPVTNNWTTKASLPAAREGGNGAVTIQGILYLAGGQSASGVLTRTLYAYNTSTNAWSSRAAMPAYSACGGSAVIAARVYVFSGCTSSSTGAVIDAGLLHRYNPTTNTWATLKAAPVTHYRPVVAAIGGKLYVAGGNNAAGTAFRRVDVYDPATNTWSVGTAMPTARANAGAAFIAGKWYVFGGKKGTAYLNTLEVYDPAANAWGTRPAMPTARAALGVGGVSGLIYAVGGRNATAALATHDRFTP
jgi:M6 family metalloprotease-like protein